MQLGLEPLGAGTDPRDRLQALEDAARQSAELASDIAFARASTMREYVKTVGGAAQAAKNLGLTRGRIYQILSHDRGAQPTR